MFNKVFLMGRLTKDPEIRYTSENNTAIARYTLAIDRAYNKPGEERQADFISCVAWGKVAEFVNNYFTKGKMMIVLGRIQTRSWDDQEGKKHYSTEVVAEEVRFGEPKGNSANKPQNDANVEAQGEEFFPIDNDDELPF